MSQARPGTEKATFTKRSVALLCSCWALRSMAARIFSVMEKMSSAGSRKILRTVSSGVPSARVFNITKLTQKWFLL